MSRIETGGSPTNLPPAPPSAGGPEQRLTAALNQNVPAGDDMAIQGRLQDVYQVLNSLSADQAKSLHSDLGDPKSEIGKLFQNKLATPTRQQIMDKLSAKSNHQEMKTRWETIWDGSSDKVDLKGKDNSQIPPSKFNPENLSNEEKQLIKREHEHMMRIVRQIKA